MAGSSDSAHFSIGDIGILSDVISEMYAPSFTDDSLRTVVGLLGRVVDQSEAGVVHLHPPNEPLWFGYSIDEDAIRQRVPLRSEILELVKSALDRGLSVWRPEDAVGKEQWEQSALYKRMSAAGIAHLVCVSFELGPKESTHFHFAREEPMGDFTPSDILMLRLFRHHLLRASLLRKTLHDAQVVQLAFQQIMRPGFVADAECRIMRMNDEARKVVARWSATESAVVTQIEDTARKVIDTGTQWQRFDCCGERSLLTVYAVRTDDAPVQYVIVLDSAEYFRDMLTKCMAGGGLTERETQICSLLVRGKSNREIAEALDILESTVKDHVTSIFHKLGVTNRSAIIPSLLGLS